MVKFVNSWVAAFLILVLLQQSLKEIGADLISDTCAKTDRAAVCEKYLRRDPRGTSAKDVIGLTRVTYDFVLSSAQGTLAQVKDLLNGASDPSLRSYLSMCSGFYNKIISDDVPTALRKFDSKSYKLAAPLMSDCMFQAQMCETSFNTGPEVRKSPLTDKNNVVVDLSDIAMYLTTSLAGSN